MTTLREHVESLRGQGCRYALTLWPEWQLPILGLPSAAKRIECRTWAPGPWILSEPIVLHWGAHIGGRRGGPAEEEGRGSILSMAARAGWIVVGQVGDVVELARGEEHTTWDLGAIRRFALGAVVQVTALLRPKTTDDPWAVPWCWGWRFEVVRVLEDPPTCKGSRGLWPLRELLGES